MSAPDPRLNFRQRYLVLCLVQDWIFEENRLLFEEALQHSHQNMQLELVILDREETIRMHEARVEALETALQYAEQANFDLATQNHMCYHHIRRCLHCHESMVRRGLIQRPFPRRIRRRLTYTHQPPNPIMGDSSSQSSSETESDTISIEELPSDPEDAQL